MPDASVRRDDLGDAMSKPVPAPVDGWTFARDVDGRLSARATSACVAILNDELCVGVFNYESDADIPLSVIRALLADATPVDWMDPIAAEESARRLAEEVKRADANETWANHWRGLYGQEIALIDESQIVTVDSATLQSLVAEVLRSRRGESPADESDLAAMAVALWHVGAPEHETECPEHDTERARVALTRAPAAPPLFPIRIPSWCRPGGLP